VKITSIKSHVLRYELDKELGYSQQYYKFRTAHLVEVQTDEGITGWGECFGPGNIALANKFIVEKVIQPLIIGEDPLNKEHIWHKVYNLLRDSGQKGMPIQALSGIDIALWDILGKKTNTPLYQLVGGKCNDQIPVYGYGMMLQKKTTSELIDLFKEEAKKIKSKNFTKQIAFNLIPHIDEFVDEGYTKEEWKMEKETKKILDPKIKLTATCVRVPVMVSHSESINVEFEKDFDIKKVKDILSATDGCKVLDERKNGGYVTPVEAENKNETFISRIRKDSSNDKALNMWVVSDNLLKGAALSETTHIFKALSLELSFLILEIKVKYLFSASTGVTYPPFFLSSKTLQPSVALKISLTFLISKSFSNSTLIDSE
jgi:hypothetical protein